MYIAEFGNAYTTIVTEHALRPGKCSSHFTHTHPAARSLGVREDAHGPVVVHALGPLPEALHHTQHITKAFLA